MSRAPGPKNSRDDRVVDLLNQLGERMIRSEKDRVALKGTVKSYAERVTALEDKSENSEKVFLSLQNKLGKADEIEQRLQKRQDEIEKIQKEQEVKLARAVALTDKIEEALAQQARMNRRLEKVMQDRSRLLGKLERIEDTVIETREALNSKAMVLLTDQAVAAKTGEPQLPADPQITKEAANNNERLWWEKPLYMQVAGVAALVLLAVFAGVSLVHMPEESSEPAAYSTADSSLPLPKIEEDVKPVWPSESPFDIDSAANGKNNDNPDGSDIFDMDAETLLAQMDADPDALASSLNEIAPASGDATAATGNKPATAPGAKTAQSDEATTKTTAFTPPRFEAPEVDIDAFIKAQTDSRPLAERVKPDDNLPPVVREIENKAFEGVPEAQHDLAAIYTAGHGGVKPDYKKAAFWFKEAAIHNIANARYNLGVLYHQGMGVDQNIDLAVNWYRAAAELGHPEAQYNLGIAHIEGIGTTYNPVLAAGYFESAAEQGILEAAYNLGLIYENGLLGETDTKNALYWYKQAADQGSVEAKQAMEQLAQAINVDVSTIDSYVGSAERKKKLNPPPSEAQKPQKQTKNDRDTADKTASVENTGGMPATASGTVPAIRITEATPASGAPDVALIAQIQEQLMRVGLYPGPADGRGGPVTEDAIRSYQTAHKLNADGRASQALLVHMLTNELASSSTAFPPEMVNRFYPDGGELGSRTE